MDISRKHFSYSKHVSAIWIFQENTFRIVNMLVEYGYLKKNTFCIVNMLVQYGYFKRTLFV